MTFAIADMVFSTAFWWVIGGAFAGAAAVIAWAWWEDRQLHREEDPR